MQLRYILYKPIFIIYLFSIISYSGYSQCKDFSVNTCKLALHPFIHDGMYNAHVLSTGESAELFKTFFAELNYRVLVCKSDKIQSIQMVVMDTKHNVLYTYNLDEKANTWDLVLQSSQQLIIGLNIKKQDQIESGCVSILIGFEEKP